MVAAAWPRKTRVQRACHAQVGLYYGPVRPAPPAARDLGGGMMHGRWGSDSGDRGELTDRTRAQDGYAGISVCCNGRTGPWWPRCIRGGAAAGVTGWVWER